jgi:hypothetical protein
VAVVLSASGLATASNGAAETTGGTAETTGGAAVPMEESAVANADAGSPADVAVADAAETVASPDEEKDA